MCLSIGGGFEVLAERFSRVSQRSFGGRTLAGSIDNPCAPAGGSCASTCLKTFDDCIGLFAGPLRVLVTLVGAERERRDCECGTGCGSKSSDTNLRRDEACRSQPKRIRKIDRIPTRIPVQIEPTRQPNWVRLRELTRSETKLRRSMIPGNLRPSRRCPTGLGADGRTRPQLNG